MNIKQQQQQQIEKRHFRIFLTMMILHKQVPKFLEFLLNHMLNVSLNILHVLITMTGLSHGNKNGNQNKIIGQSKHI